MLRRILALIYGGACYIVFLAVAAYAAGFIVGVFTPTTLDGAPKHPLSQALLVDMGLLVAFAIQHSGMARRGASNGGGPASCRSGRSAARTFFSRRSQ